MRQNSAAKINLVRTLHLSVIAIGMVSLTACSWWQSRGNGYAQNPRPLEVPPEIVAQAPVQQGSVLASGQGAQASFQLAMNRDAAFSAVEKAVLQLPDTKINSSAPALGLLDVSYGSQAILVRVNDSNGQSLISATDPQASAGSAASIQAFLSALQAKLQ